MSDTSEDEENGQNFGELEENFGILDDENVPELEAVHDDILFSLYWRNRNRKSKKDDHSLL